MYYRHTCTQSVKWAWGSTAINKASGCDGIPVELFKTLNNEAIKVLHSIFQQIWKTQQSPQEWKIPNYSVIPIPKKYSTQEVQTTRQLDLSPMLVRSFTKSCMLGFSITWTKNFQTSKLGLEKEEPEIKWQHLLDHRESKGIPEKYLPLFHRLC